MAACAIPPGSVRNRATHARNREPGFGKPRLARFHNTLGAAAAEMVAHATDRAGRLPVVLTGGCFQNARLVEEVLRALGQRTVLRHGEIPPGDGGLALGQALVADAVARSTS